MTDHIFEKGLRIRLVEEKLLELFQEGKLNGTVHTCIGQELIGVCLAENLKHEDYVISNHRGHGHLLSREDDLTAFFAELMGRKNGICQGMGGSQHLCTSNFLSNGIQGGMTPLAAGLAMAQKIRGAGQVVCCFIGDGTLGEGIIYEAFNIAAKWELPVIYVLENNRIAQSTSIKQTLAGDIQKRAEGFGLKYQKTNIWDVEDMIGTFGEAVSNAREHSTAQFVEVDVYRLYSHSKSDDNRDASEVASFREKDLLGKFLAEDPSATDYAAATKQEINAAVKKAAEGALLTESPKQPQREDSVSFAPIKHIEGKRVNELIYEALKTQFEQDNRTVLIGEDIQYVTKFTPEPYGGAFKVTKDLSERFPHVHNTPISEAAIVGIGNGLAIGGQRAIVEVMFGDFLTLAFDQLLNHASKFRTMFAGKVNVPLLVRTPMGGRRGYGPTHSQSIEKFFLGIPDLCVLALNHRVDPRKVYASAFQENGPVLMIENKVLYTQMLDTDAPAGFELALTNEAYPVVKMSPIGRSPEVTILCYGGMLSEVEKAAQTAFVEEEILCEIICPTQINPAGRKVVAESVRSTGRLVVVEEGSSVAAFGSEVVSSLLEDGVPIRAVKRLGNNEIIPSSFEGELECLPSVQSIFKSIVEISS